MRQVTVRKIWMVAFLMAGFVAGCGREQAPSPVAPVVTIPTVISTNPLNGATNVPINQKIAATFSGAMNPATVIAPGTFTVAGAGGAAVPGTVTYVAATKTATFAPTANLLPSTQYTATIHTAAQSAAGGTLASNYVWSFTRA